MRYVDAAVTRNDGVAIQLRFEIEVTPFDQGFRTAQGRTAMHGGQQAGAVIKGVDHHGDAVGVSQRIDFLQFGDATHFGRAGLNEIDRAGFKQVLEVHQRRRVFAGCNRDAALLAHRRQPRIVFRRPHRLFDPAQIQRAKFLGHVERFAHRPGGVDVEGDFHPGASGFARGANDLDIHLVQLEVAETAVDRALYVDADEFGVGIADQACIGRQRSGFTAAKQLVDRSAGRFARDIPQRDVNRREPIDEGTAATEDVKFLLQIALQLLPPSGITADQFGRKDSVDHDFDSGYRGKTEGFTPANDAVIGGDLDHEGIDHLKVFRPPNPAGRPPSCSKGDSQRNGFNTGNFHRRCLKQVATVARCFWISPVPG